MSKIQTYSGKVFDFLNPLESAIDIQDIAHALSLINRFTGHTLEPYCVAHHCVSASYIVPEPLALQALMHDAAEAYVGDLNKPLKAICPGYMVIEAGVWRVIAAKFGLPEVLDPLIHSVDMMMLHAEKINYLSSCEDPKLWAKLDTWVIGHILPTPRITRRPYGPVDFYEFKTVYHEHWKTAFIERFESLTSGTI